MAVQLMKTSYNGSVDLGKRVVHLPPPQKAPQPRKAETGRLDTLRMAIAGLPMAVLSMASVPALAAGTDFTLTDGNSTVNYNSVAGVTSWKIDGIQELNVQQFYYRIGNTGGQTPISGGLNHSTITQPLPDLVHVIYKHSNYTAVVDYKLTAGNAPGDPSVLSETINLKNTQSNRPLPLHFYKYSDFNLNGQASGQTVKITGSPANTAVQKGPLAVSSETVGQGASGPPSRVQAGTGAALINSITGGTYTLNGNKNAGPGDVNFAFEWDATLGKAGSPDGGDTFQVGIPTTIQPAQSVPEPAGLGMVAAAGGLFLARRRRRQARAETAGSAANNQVRKSTL